MTLLSETIKNLRLQLFLDQKEFAEIIGIKKGTVSNYENGYRKPRLPIIRRMLELARKNKIKLNPEDFLN